MATQTIRVRARRDYADPEWGWVAEGDVHEMYRDDAAHLEYLNRYDCLEIVDGEGPLAPPEEPTDAERFAQTVPDSDLVDVVVVAEVFEYDGRVYLAGESGKIPPAAVRSLGADTFRLADDLTPAKQIASGHEIRKRLLIRTEEGSRLRDRVAEAEAGARIASKALADLDDRAERAGEKIDGKSFDMAKAKLDDAKDALRRRRTALERWDGETSQERATLEQDLAIAERREVRDQHQTKIDGLRDKFYLAFRRQLLAASELIAADFEALEAENRLVDAVAAANEALGGRYYQPGVNRFELSASVSASLAALRDDVYLHQAAGVMLELDDRDRWVVTLRDDSVRGRVSRVGRAVASAIGR